MFEVANAIAYERLMFFGDHQPCGRLSDSN
jgi:hypothetical protein